MTTTTATTTTTGSEGGDEDDDEWTTVRKPSVRRHRPNRRRRDRRHNNRSNDAGGDGTGHQHHHHHQPRDARSRAAFEKAVAEARFLSDGGVAAAAPSAAVDDDDEALVADRLSVSLAVRCAELRGSRYWEALRTVLDARFGRSGGDDDEGADVGVIRSVVCYGIGTFGTVRPSAPQWQLALALLIREHATSDDDAVDGDDEGTVSMHYFEPLMTEPEAEVLRRLGVDVIAENERGKRSVRKKNDGDDDNDRDAGGGGGGGVTLFFMPHCPMALYANVLHANWGILRDGSVAVFGNTLGNYLLDMTTTVGTAGHRQALDVLEQARPFWTVDPLRIDRRDVGDLPAGFENAFNDSSLTTFSVTTTTTTNTTTTGWPDRSPPPLDDPGVYDGSGEVL